LPVLAAAILFIGASISRAAPFAIQGPGVNPADFRLTTFAAGLSHPLGMAELADGSLLLAVSRGSSFWNSVGEIIRLVDTNKDGVADGPGVVLYTGLPGGQTSLRIGGNLIFVTGQGAGKPITILRAGATPGDPLTRIGAININYPGGSWSHPHSALGIRASPGRPGSFDLLFQLGSKANFAPTTATATLSNDQVPGASGTLEGDSIYLLTISDQPPGVTASNLTRLARGLRNPAGFAFQPATGDLYFEDNGIDGLVNVNEPTSADELNRIPAADIGGNVEDFGFPNNYTAYRTGTRVGGAGIQPLIAFQPLPDPQNGSESEGPNDIAFAPRAFPSELNRGIFIGFHGRFSAGGLANEENPLVYADPTTGQYFHFIGNNEAGVGHLDGLLATADSLFIADLAPQGDLGSSGGTGVVYQLKSLASPTLSFRRVDDALELTWAFGTLQSTDGLSGMWNDVGNAVSPQTVQLDQAAVFYRVSN
ncbi:MAG TPA: hypothetical protein PLX89_28065, partial [Verrucomicrobiota bacterium]|nr:hypothetical protein [Verrucomicrobiota bacterium]